MTLWTMELIGLQESRYVTDVVDSLADRFDKYGVLKRCAECGEDCQQYAAPGVRDECWKYPGPLFAEKLRQLAEKAA